LGKKFYNSLKIGPNCFLQHFKNKVTYSFVKCVTAKKGLTKKNLNLSLLLLFLDPESGIRDPGSEIRDPRSGIRDPGWVKPGSGIQDKHPGSATL
jgi:hypothetical protein